MSVEVDEARSQQAATALGLRRIKGRCRQVDGRNLAVAQQHISGFDFFAGAYHPNIANELSFHDLRPGCD
jgi:hypothetical protein